MRCFLLLLAALAFTAQAAPVPERLVRTQGRMAAAPGGGWLATWPGTAWTLRFEGRAVGVTLDDALNHWVLEIDGQPRLQIAPAAGPRTVWLRGLAASVHVATLVKRTERPAQAAHVVGFELDGGRALPPPPLRTRRIEFIGDSFTAAYGNLSASRSCADIPAQTDVTRSFAVLAARALDADWRIHAASGMGLVRNWAGGRPNETHGTQYARLLQDRPGPPPDDGWVPDTVVIGLGTNDFSTPVKPGEPRDAAMLEREFLAAYRQLLSDVRRRAPQARLLLLSVGLPGNGDRLRPLVKQIAVEHGAATLDWGAITAMGCDGHPDLADHRHMAARLVLALQARD